MKNEGWGLNIKYQFFDILNIYGEDSKFQIWEGALCFWNWQFWTIFFIVHGCWWYLVYMMYSTSRCKCNVNWVELLYNIAKSGHNLSNFCECFVFETFFARYYKTLLSRKLLWSNVILLEFILLCSPPWKLFVFLNTVQSVEYWVKNVIT